MGAVFEYSYSPFKPYAAGASEIKRRHIGGRIGLVDSASETNKARAVVERSVFIRTGDTKAYTLLISLIEYRNRNLYCKRIEYLDTDLTRNTRAPHFTPQHWLLCHTYGLVLVRVRVSCSTCADWPKALQNTCGVEHPGVFPHEGNVGIRQRAPSDTRQAYAHTHSACLGTAARSHSPKKHAPLLGAERKQLTSGRIFCCWPWFLDHQNVNLP